MITFFQWASNDQSVLYLDQLFGYMDNVLPTTEGTTTIMSAMLKTINTTALVLGVILLINTTIRGLLKTAQEGEFLGKEWSSLWVPVRTVVGVASLFPTAAGYSLLQIALMWVIVQGIGAADSLWTTVLKYVQTTGSPYTSIVGNANLTPMNGNTNSSGSTTCGSTSTNTTGSSITIPSAIQGLYNALACQETLASTYQDTHPDSSNNPVDLYYCKAGSAHAEGEPFCALSADQRADITATPPTNGIYTYNMGPAGTCGVMQFPDPKTYVDPNHPTNGIICQGTTTDEIVNCAGMTQQVATLKSIVGTMATFAANIAQIDHNYLQFYNGITPAPKIVVPFKTPDWVQQFCTLKSIGTNDCCMSINAPVGSTNACQSQNSFPAPYLSNGQSPYSDESTDAVTNIIWPYAISAPLGTSADEVTLMTNKYIGDVNTAVANAMIGTATLTGNYAQMGSSGWLVAGTYYYQIASLSNSAITATMPPLTVAASSDPAVTDASLNGYRVNFATATDIEAAVSGASNCNGSSGGSNLSAVSPGAAKLSNNLSGTASSITGNFMNELSGGGISTNPLVSAQAFGENLLISAQVTYVPLLVLTTAVILVSNINVMGLGEGATENPFGPMTEMIAIMVWALYIFFAGWCFTFGGMLAIYLPLVPYIIFTFGAIGWFISVIEAMVAAPFVAIGIMSPTGHEIYGRAEPAIMIILNIFLRPTLMIFGMMAGMVLAPLVVTMINGGFNVVVGSIYGSSHSPGPVELILFITAYGSLVCTSMNKCFAVIYMIPDRVLTWLGGQASSGGEAEGLRDVKGGFDAAAGTIKDAAEGGGRTMHDAAVETGRSISAKNKDLNARMNAANAATVTGSTSSPGSDEASAASEGGETGGKSGAAAAAPAGAKGKGGGGGGAAVPKKASLMDSLIPSRKALDDAFETVDETKARVKVEKAETKKRIETIKAEKKAKKLVKKSGGDKPA